MGLDSLKVQTGGGTAEEPVVATGTAESTTTGGVVLKDVPESQQGQENGNTADRPAWLPEKFQSAEALAKAYQELEKKVSGGGEGEQLTATPVETTPSEQALHEAGFDMAALATEYDQQGGKLTEATLKALESKGINREAVNTYIAGQEALAREVQTSLANIAGDMGALDATLAWARTNLDDGAKAAFDAALDSRNPGLVEMAFRAINSQYKQQMGDTPRNVGGAAAPTSGVAQFESWEDVSNAMSDPRYHNSPEYRKQVDARVAVSTKL